MKQPIVVILMSVAAAIVAGCTPFEANNMGDSDTAIPVSVHSIATSSFSDFDFDVTFREHENAEGTAANNRGTVKVSLPVLFLNDLGGRSLRTAEFRQSITCYSSPQAQEGTDKKKTCEGIIPVVNDNRNNGAVGGNIRLNVVCIDTQPGKCSEMILVVLSNDAAVRTLSNQSGIAVHLRREVVESQSRETYVFVPGLTQQSIRGRVNADDAFSIVVR